MFHDELWQYFLARTATEFDETSRELAIDIVPSRLGDQRQDHRLVRLHNIPDI